MTSHRVLLASIPAGLVIAGLAVLLPTSAASPYAKVMQPGLVLLGSALAFWVGPMCRGVMGRAFYLIGGYLLLYGLVSITPLVDEARELLYESFLRALIGYQVFAYALLIGGCAHVLRVIGIGRLRGWSWTVVAVSVALAVVIVVYGMPKFREILDGNSEVAALLLTIRILDMIVIVMLVPVVAMYVQNARDRYQESATFTVIGAGIIASLVLAYLYELARRTSLVDIANNEYQTGSTLDALYVFAYFVLALGLFVHRKHQEWSFARLDRLLA